MRFITLDLGGLPRLAALAGLALASAASAQIAVEAPADPYVHRQTGMAFPVRIAGAVRHQVERYNDDASDIGVGYQVARGGHMVAYVSVFVYPAPPLTADTEAARSYSCSAIFTGIKRDILSHEPTAKVVSEGPIAAPSPRFGATGLRVIYRGGRTTLDGADRRVREQADLFCYAGGKWLVSYRATTPDAAPAAAAIDEMMRALGWPETLARVSPAQRIAPPPWPPLGNNAKLPDQR